MPADLGYDDVAEVESQTRIVGWVRAVFGLLARLVTANPFGDVARADTGTADGNAPVLDAGARVASPTCPRSAWPEGSSAPPPCRRSRPRG